MTTDTSFTNSCPRSSVVELLICNQRVGGSNPSVGSKIINNFNNSKNRPVFKSSSFPKFSHYFFQKVLSFRQFLIFFKDQSFRLFPLEIEARLNAVTVPSGDDELAEAFKRSGFHPVLLPKK